MTDQIATLKAKIANDKAQLNALINQIKADEYNLSLLEDQEKLIKTIESCQQNNSQ
jgi:hypothetical protein